MAVAQSGGMRRDIADLVVKTKESHLDDCVLVKNRQSADGMLCLCPTHLQGEEILYAAKYLQPSNSKCFDMFGGTTRKIYQSAADETDVSSSEADHDTRGHHKRKSKPASACLANTTDTEDDDDPQPDRKKVKKALKAKPVLPFISFEKLTNPLIASISACGSSSILASSLVSEKKEKPGPTSTSYCESSSATTLIVGSHDTSSQSSRKGKLASSFISSNKRNKFTLASGGGSTKRFNMNESPKPSSNIAADPEALNSSTESNSDELLTHTSTPIGSSDEGDCGSDYERKDCKSERRSQSPDSVSIIYDVEAPPDSSIHELKDCESGNGGLVEKPNECGNVPLSSSNGEVKVNSAKRKRTSNITSAQLKKMDTIDILWLLYEKTLSIEQKMFKIESGVEEVRQLLLNRTEVLKVPEGLPELPLKTLDDAQIAEDIAQKEDTVKDFLMKKLSFASKGNTENECAKKVMGLLMTNHTGNFFNWKGNNGKTPFEHWVLKDIVISVVRKLRVDVDTKQAENGIKEWFKSRKCLLK